MATCRKRKLARCRKRKNPNTLTDKNAGEHISIYAHMDMASAQKVGDAPPHRRRGHVQRLRCYTIRVTAIHIKTRPFTGALKFKKRASVKSYKYVLLTYIYTKRCVIIVFTSASPIYYQLSFISKDFDDYFPTATPSKFTIPKTSEIAHT